MNIEEREISLREYFKTLKNNLNKSINSMAIELDIPERTIREFVVGYKNKDGVKKTRTLSPENYNKIVTHLKTLPLHVRRLNFENLILLLKGVHKKSIKWDTSPAFKQEEVEKLEQFRDFVQKDMQITNDEYLKGKSFLELINISNDVDPFKQNKRYSIVHKKFEENFRKHIDLKLGIFGANYYKFLMKGDEKEIFIFLTFDKSMDQTNVFQLTSPHKGLFSPKLWKI